jgi:UDP-N-acetylmuramate dehydrogenase
MNYSKDLKRLIKGKVLTNEPLSRHTTFKIGGPADVWVEPEGLDDLKRVLYFSKRKKISLFIIGRGSNLLADDKGFRGIIIKFNSGIFKKIEIQGNYISVGCGVSLKRIIQSALDYSLGGCEFLVGIPASLGGALIMNAGIRRNSVFNNHFQSIGDLVEEVSVMDFNGQVKRLTRADINFGYHYSDLGRYIVISAKLRLNRKDKSRIRHELNDFLKYKRSTQDLDCASAGCIFKNPYVVSSEGMAPKILSAGYLIDMVGLKKYRIGGAVISEKHANYILNDNNAKATDVIKIIRFVQKKIKEKFNITLEPEIKIILNDKN